MLYFVRNSQQTFFYFAASHWRGMFLFLLAFSFRIDRIDQRNTNAENIFKVSKHEDVVIVFSKLFMNTTTS